MQTCTYIYMNALTTIQCTAIIYVVPYQYMYTVNALNVHWEFIYSKWLKHVLKRSHYQWYLYLEVCA